MIRIQNQLIVFIVISLTAACSSEVPVTGLDVRAVTSAGEVPDSPSELSFTDDGDTAFAFQSAYLHLRDIELDLPEGVGCADVADALVGATCDTDKIAIAGPFDIDLVTGRSTPDLAGLGIPAQTYRRIDFRVDDNPDDTSFAVIADFDRDGQAFTLDLALDFNEDIRIESADGVSVDADTDLIAKFVVDDWLRGVDVGACMDNGDVTIDAAVVTIDDNSTSGSCSNIEDTIKTNMKDSGQLDKQ